MKDRGLVIVMVALIVVILGFVSTKIEWPVSHDHVAVVNLAAPASVDTVRAALNTMPGVSGVAIDKNGRTLYVAFIANRVSSESLKKSLAASGFAATAPEVLTAQEFRRKTGNYFNPNCADCMSGCGR